MFKQFTAKRIFALTLALALCAGLLAGCGGGNSIPNGRYEPADGSASFTYLNFKGSNVEIGSGFGETTVSSETVKYTLKNGELSFSIGGIPFDLPYEIDGNTLTLGGAKYVKGGVKAANTPQGNGEATPSPSETAAGTTRTNGGASAFDGEYINKTAYGSETLTIANGEYKLSGIYSASGMVGSDGSFDANISYMGEFHFVHEHDSYWFEDRNGSKTDFTLVGGKSLFQYTIEDQTADLPEIALQHRILDNSKSLNDIRNLPESDIFTRSKYVYEQYDTFFTVTSDNELWAWGENGYGQLGDGSGVDREVPVKILDNISDIRVYGYGGYVIAYGTDGKVWHWGNADSYIIFTHKSSDVYEPELAGENIAEVFVFDGSALIIKPGGDVLLQKQSYTVSTGEIVPSVTLMHKVKYIYPERGGSGTGAFVVFSDDSLYYYPNLLNTSANPPVISMSEREKLFDNADIYTSYYDESRYVWYVDSSQPLIVITTNGELWGKGENSSGQLGDGTKIDKDDWIKIAEGVSVYGRNFTGDKSTREDDYDYYYTKLDGSIWVWNADNPTPQQLVVSTESESTDADAPAEAQDGG
jgi:hypothetical protein